MTHCSSCAPRRDGSSSADPSSRVGRSPRRARRLETFRAAGRDGWTLLRWLSVGLWFLALTLLAARFVRPAWVAGVSVATAGLVSWAVVFDQTHPCAIEGSECYQGVATAAAVILSILIIAVALGVAGLARYARRLRSRRG